MWPVVTWSLNKREKPFCFGVDHCKIQRLLFAIGLLKSAIYYQVTVVSRRAKKTNRNLSSIFQKTIVAMLIWFIVASNFAGELAAVNLNKPAKANANLIQSGVLSWMPMWWPHLSNFQKGNTQVYDLCLVRKEHKKIPRRRFEPRHRTTVPALFQLSHSCDMETKILKCHSILPTKIGPKTPKLFAWLFSTHQRVGEGRGIAIIRQHQPATSSPVFFSFSSFSFPSIPYLPFTTSSCSDTK